MKCISENYFKNKLQVYYQTYIDIGKNMRFAKFKFKCTSGNYPFSHCIRKQQNILIQLLDNFIVESYIRGWMLL